jgi:VanZ family protein
MQKVITHYLPPLIWAGIIFYLSSIPNLKITQSSWDTLLRSLAHIFFYFVLFLLILRSTGSTTKRNSTISAILSVLYAFSDEWHQSFVPTRVADPFDLMLDSTGVLLGVIFSKLWPRFLK